jgi:hypothetical protein
MDVKTTQNLRDLDPAIIKRQSWVCAAIWFGGAIVLFALGCLLRTMHASGSQQVKGTYVFFVFGAGLLVLAASMPSMGRLRAGFARIDRLLHAGGEISRPPPSGSDLLGGFPKFTPTVFLCLLVMMIGMAIYSIVTISVFAARIWFAFVGYAMLCGLLATSRNITKWRLDQILRRLGVNPDADTPCPDPYRRVRRRKIGAFIVWTMPIFFTVIACLWLYLPIEHPEIEFRRFLYTMNAGQAFGLSCLVMFELSTQRRFERIYHALDFDCDVWSRQSAKRMSAWRQLVLAAAVVVSILVAGILILLVYILIKEWTFAVHVWAMAMGYIMIFAWEMTTLFVTRKQLRAIARHMSESAEDIESAPTTGAHGDVETGS